MVNLSRLFSQKKFLCLKKSLASVVSSTSKPVRTEEKQEKYLNQLPLSSAESLNVSASEFQNLTSLTVGANYQKDTSLIAFQLVSLFLTSLLFSSWRVNKDFFDIRFFNVRYMQQDLIGKTNFFSNKILCLVLSSVYSEKKSIQEF